MTLYFSSAKLRAMLAVSPCRHPGWSKIGSCMPCQRSTAPAMTIATMQCSRYLNGSAVLAIAERPVLIDEEVHEDASHRTDEPGLMPVAESRRYQRRDRQADDERDARHGEELRAFVHRMPGRTERP